MSRCDHCLLEVPEENMLFHLVKGERKSFCCRGCLGVYLLIDEEGLGDFYEKRGAGWVPGPPEESFIDVSAFNDNVRKTGDGMETEIIIGGIRCASCIWILEKVLLRTEGVEYAKFNYATHKGRIRWNHHGTSLEDVLCRIKSVGYVPRPCIEGVTEEQVKRERRDLLVRFGTAAFFSMQLMLYSIALYAGYFQGMEPGTKALLQGVSLLLTTPVIFYSGMPLIRGAVRGLWNCSLNMDVLIVAGAGSAYLYSIFQMTGGGEVYFDTAAMIITLILLGRYIEAGAKSRASGAIAGLYSLNPKEARVVKGGGTEAGGRMVMIASIKKNDLVEVRPGERVPLDGTLTMGASEVDESMLTGESRPVAKKEGSAVFGGTQNLYGSFVFRVERTGKDTVLSRIVKAVEDAQARQAPVQVLADRAAGIFVPAVLILSVITAAYRLYSAGEMTHALMNAVSVLVIACPCALGLAAPLAVLTGTTNAASRGMLFKGGDVIERMNGTDTVVFDKTGTVTEGIQELVTYKGIGITNGEALALASSLEYYSEHSISRAIAGAGADNVPSPVKGFRAFPGRGIKGTVKGRCLLVGSRSFVESEGIQRSMEDVMIPGLKSWVRAEEDSGATVVYMSCDGELSGIFIISDTVRAEAAGAVDKLKDMEKDMLLVTGDSAGSAIKTARDIGLTDGQVLAGRSPIEKAALIKEIQKNGRRVLMVGDGINDAPALTQADVGMAMGGATDIALESADIVLMNSDLELVPEAVRLSGKIYSVIKQNLFWAFAYNMAAIPLAVAGVLHPIAAALCMTLSSLSVVGNSVRIGRG